MMNREMIRIGDTEIPVMEYDGQRVVTFRMIDEVHRRPDGTARKRFSENKNRFRKEKHYFEISKSGIKAWLEGMSEKRTDCDNSDSYGNIPPRQYLITERGYLLLVKSFTDELAWEVQERLVEGYFRGKTEPGDPFRPLAELLAGITRRQEEMQAKYQTLHRSIAGMNSRLFEASRIMMDAVEMLAGCPAPGEVAQVFTLACSPVIRFVEERCGIYPHTHIPCADLFAAYTLWCHEENVLPLGRTRFYEEILKYAGVCRCKGTVLDGSRRWVFTGIGLR